MPDAAEGGERPDAITRHSRRRQICMENHENLKWVKTKEKHLVRNQWIDFRESEWRFPDGVELGPFYTFTRKDYVVVVARCEDGRFLTVYQFRQGIEQVTCEFPAGGIEEGETPFEAAVRELREETGYVSDEWRAVARIPSNATIADNYAHIFYAGNCRKTGEQSLDPLEFMDVVLMDREQLQDLIRKDAFHQAIHVMAYYRAMEN